MPEKTKHTENHATSQGVNSSGLLDCVYGISRWTNPSRASARHIDNGKGLPLCGGNGRKAFCWEHERSIPTCKKCIRLQRTI